MATKPSIPKGTRDFSPQEMLRRKYIFSTIEKVFQKYGYLPLETPAMENLETLTGKYGEEGDRLIFKVLDSGEFMANIPGELRVEQILNLEVQDMESMIGFSKRIAPHIASKALRYDLTVPFARYVVQHQSELTFPFKRYQIQPVWRADRPQKGRYREFYQCDADVIGSTSLTNEIELVSMIDEVFRDLGIRVQVLTNSRKLLAGLAEIIGRPDKLIEIAGIMDKFDKVSLPELEMEAEEKGVGVEGLRKIVDLAERTKGKRMTLDQVLTEYRDYFKTSEIGMAGVEEVGTIITRYHTFDPISTNVFTLDLSLARGLDYYTGAIFEVRALEGTLNSSICGGGRYDDLTGIFGLKNMSGVGISFGADRIYDVLLETNKFPDELGSSTKLLFANFGEAEALHCLKLLRQVREAGIAAELYPDNTKLPKQFTYAEKKGIPYAAIVGETEMKEGKVTLKKMGAGEKGELITVEEMIQRLKG